jgi:hypothetical protein
LPNPEKGKRITGLCIPLLLVVFVSGTAIFVISIGSSSDNVAYTLLESWEQLPSWARRPNWCGPETYPVVWPKNDGAMIISCTIFSPNEIAIRSRMHAAAVDALIRAGLLPDPVKVVEFDPKLGRYEIQVSRPLSDNEVQTLKTVLPAPFNVSVFKAVPFNHVQPFSVL